jgi:hypothetical protein
MRWIIFLLIFPGKIVFAQSPDSIQNHSVKIDFANFLDDFPALLISYEHPIGKNLYLTHEGGPIIQAFSTDNRKISGFKLKEELRFILDQWNNNDLYIGLSARYSQENLFTNVVYGYGCNGRQSCTYFQNYYGEFQKKMISFDARLGFKHNFNPFFIEYDLGFGYGKDEIYSPDIEAGEGSTRITTNPYNTFLTGWRVMISGRANIGFKFFPKKNQLK